MFPNVDLSTRDPLLAVLAPSSQATGAQSTGWIAVKDYFSFMAVVNVGALGVSGTVDAKLEQATDSSGTGAKDVTGKAITQITANNKTAVINAMHNDIDMDNDFTHVRLTVTVGTAASLTAAQVFGADARYSQASNNVADEVV